MVMVGGVTPPPGGGAGGRATARHGHGVGLEGEQVAEGPGALAVAPVAGSELVNVTWSLNILPKYGVMVSIKTVPTTAGRVSTAGMAVSFHGWDGRVFPAKRRLVRCLMDRPETFWHNGVIG